MSKTTTKPVLTIRKTKDQQLTSHLLNSLQQQLQIVMRDTEYTIGELISNGNNEFDLLITWGIKNGVKMDRTIDITVRKEVADSTGYGSTNRYDLTFNFSHDGLPVIAICNFLQRELQEPTAVSMSDGSVKVIDYGIWQKQFQATGLLSPTAYIPRS